MTAITQTFLSHGTRCTGDMYIPEGEGPHACVVMAHGFAAQRDFALEPFAHALVSAGMAVFVFDYRGFGDSDGLPRQWVSPRRHIQDYHAALAHVRSIAEIDKQRLGLWGTSFSGGHVLVVAAQDQRIKAVSSMVPFVNGPASLRRIPIIELLKMTWAGIRDWLQVASGGPTYQLPVIGKPGELAMMNTPDSYLGYLDMIPKGSSWRNETPARVALSAGFYMPSRFAPQVNCPTLVVAGKQDSLVPLENIRETAGNIPQCDLEILDCRHFEPYQGDLLAKVSRMQAHFMAEHLLA